MLSVKSKNEQLPSSISPKLLQLRQQLEKGFGSDTAAQGYSSKAPGAGQCAAVATIVYELLGGELVSVRTKEGSHWFNRIEYADMTLDVDLTGDQFDLDPVLIGKPATIYSGSRTRNFESGVDEIKKDLHPEKDKMIIQHLDFTVNLIRKIDYRVEKIINLNNTSHNACDVW